MLRFEKKCHVLFEHPQTQILATTTNNEPPNEVISEDKPLADIKVEEEPPLVDIKVEEEPCLVEKVEENKIEEEDLVDAKEEEKNESLDNETEISLLTENNETVVEEKDLVNVETSENVTEKKETIQETLIEEATTGELEFPGAETKQVNELQVVEETTKIAEDTLDSPVDVEANDENIEEPLAERLTTTSHETIEASDVSENKQVIEDNQEITELESPVAVEQNEENIEETLAEPLITTSHESIEDLNVAENKQTLEDHVEITEDKFEPLIVVEQFDANVEETTAKHETLVAKNEKTLEAHKEIVQENFEPVDAENNANLEETLAEKSTIEYQEIAGVQTDIDTKDTPAQEHQEIPEEKTEPPVVVEIQGKTSEIQEMIEEPLKVENVSETNKSYKKQEETSIIESSPGEKHEINQDIVESETINDSQDSPDGEQVMLEEKIEDPATVDEAKVIEFTEEPRVAEIVAEVHKISEEKQEIDEKNLEVFSESKAVKEHVEDEFIVETHKTPEESPQIVTGNLESPIENQVLEPLAAEIVQGTQKLEEKQTAEENLEASLEKQDADEPVDDEIDSKAPADSQEAKIVEETNIISEEIHQTVEENLETRLVEDQEIVKDPVEMETVPEKMEAQIEKQEIKEQTENEIVDEIHEDPVQEKLVSPIEEQSDKQPLAPEVVEGTSEEIRETVEEKLEASADEVLEIVKEPEETEIVSETHQISEEKDEINEEKLKNSYESLEAIKPAEADIVPSDTIESLEETSEIVEENLENPTLATQEAITESVEAFIVSDFQEKEESDEINESPKVQEEEPLVHNGTNMENDQGEKEDSNAPDASKFTKEETLDSLEEKKVEEHSEIALIPESIEVTVLDPKGQLDSQPTEIAEEILEAVVLEKPKESVHLEVNTVAIEPPVTSVEVIEETLESVRVAAQLESPPIVVEEENQPKLDEQQQQITEENILTTEKSENVEVEVTPDPKVSETFEVHRSSTQEKVEIKEDGSKEVVKEEIQVSESRTKTSNSNEANEIVNGDEGNTKSITKSEAIVSRLSEKKTTTTTTTTSADVIESKILKEILNFDQKSNKPKDDQPDISGKPVLVSEIQKMPIETNGKDFIKNHWGKVALICVPMAAIIFSVISFYG